MSAAAQTLVVLAVAVAWPSAWQTVLLLGIFALNAYVNARQHWSQSFSAVAMDGLFGVTCGAPIVITTWAAADGSPSLSVWLLAAAMAVHAVVLNAGGGNLKDLDNDLWHGAQTTAIQLGVRRGPSGDPLLTKRYRRFVLGSQIVASMLTIAGAAAGELVVRRAPTCLIVVLLLGLATWNVSGMIGTRPTGNAPRPWYPIASMLAVVAALGSTAPVDRLTAVALTSAVWPVLVLAAIGRGRVVVDAARRALGRPSVSAPDLEHERDR